MGYAEEIILNEATEVMNQIECSISLNTDNALGIDNNILKFVTTYFNF